jgi:hypothetical protein
MEGWSGDYDLLKTVGVNTVYPAIVWFWVLIHFFIELFERKELL